MAESFSKASSLVLRISTDAHLYDDSDDASIPPSLDSRFDSDKSEALKRPLVLIAQGTDAHLYGVPVDQIIATLSRFLEPGDAIIDGGNEWYENTERRISEASPQSLLYLGMSISGGEEGAHRGPSLMPGGSRQAFDNVADILSKVAAQVDDGPRVTYVGPGGVGNFVKMVYNGIEYGDMQLISEAYCGRLCHCPPPPEDEGRDHPSKCLHFRLNLHRCF